MMILIFIIALYFLIYGGLILFQEKLIFFPPEKNILSYSVWRDHEIDIPGELTLQAWHIKNINVNNDLAIIYFGGNAEDVVSGLELTANYNARHIFYVNLSGYGESHGRPSEKAFFMGGLAAFDFVNKTLNIPNSKILLVGRSIGTATAIYVASERQPGKLVLVTPFKSIRAMMPKWIKFFVPLDFLLRNKFNNVKNIEQVTCPVLILAASNDGLIPFAQVRVIYSRVKSHAKLKIIDATDHQNIVINDRFFKAVNLFLSENIQFNC